MARTKLANQNLRAVEVQDSERPLYKVYRPAPVAHSNSLLVSPDPRAFPLPHANRRALRDPQNKKANEAAALDRLLAPEFSGETFPGGGGGGGAGGRSSFDSPVMGNGGDDGADEGDGVGGRIGLGLGRRSSQRSGGIGQIGGGGGGGGRRRLTNATGSSGRSNRSGGAGGLGETSSNSRIRRESFQRNRNDHLEEPEEELSTKALGVYLDSSGKLHDKEYDPFEHVRSMTRKRVEKQKAFGATRSREDDSEVGSDVSGSAVSGLGGLGPGKRVGSNTYSGATTGMGERYRGGSDEAEVIRRGLMEDHRGIEYGTPAEGYLGQSYRTGKTWVGEGGDKQDLEEEEGNDEFEDAHEYPPGASTSETFEGNRTRSNTRTSQPYSEYDSGYSATSPRMPPSDGPRSPIGKEFGSAQFEGAAVPAPAPPTIPSMARLKQEDKSGRQSFTGAHGQGRISSSAKTHSSILSREERPRALLYPQTPAQAAAAQKKAGKSKASNSSIREEPLQPPMAPFNPQFGHHKQGRNNSAPNSIHGERRGSKNSTLPSGGHHNARRGSLDNGKPASTVFSAHEQGYLPTRWAGGDKQFRAGEEEIDRYRPLEWSGSQNPNPAEQDYGPSCSDMVKRNWQELKLAFRFGAHRTKKKIERKVQMM